MMKPIRKLLNRFEFRVVERWEPTSRAGDVALDLVDIVLQRAKGWTCLLYGHEPTMDHCGMPKHDYCRWCGVLTPGQAPRQQA